MLRRKAKICLVYTSSEGRIGFEVDDKYYEYRIDTGYLPEVRRMSRRQPGKALNFVKKVSSSWIKIKDLKRRTL